MAHENVRFTIENNKNQNNLVKDGMVCLCSTGGDIKLTVWLQFAIAYFN